MTIEFSYEGDVSHLSKAERKQLEKDLGECLDSDRWTYFDINRKELSIGGSYDDQDGYRDDHEDIESVLDKYEIDWRGNVNAVDDNEPSAEYCDSYWDSLERYDAEDAANAI